MHCLLLQCFAYHAQTIARKVNKGRFFSTNIKNAQIVQVQVKYQ